MPDELDYYIAEMKAGRLRIVLGPTTPQTWTVDYMSNRSNRGDRGDRGGQFLKRRYDEYTDELHEEILDEDEVRDIIQRFGGGRIWGAEVERVARKQSKEGERAGAEEAL